MQRQSQVLLPEPQQVTQPCQPYPGQPQQVRTSNAYVLDIAMKHYQLVGRVQNNSEQAATLRQQPSCICNNALMAVHLRLAHWAFYLTEQGL